MGGSFGAMVGSGINGYVQTGTIEGFARGFASGAIPQDLGFSNAYLNNPIANIGIGIARDGIRGAISADSRDGVLPGIAYGQANNAVGHLVGWASSGFRAPEFRDGAFTYQQSNAVNGGGTQGLTIGNVISINDPFNEITAHEFAHIPQSEFLGALYLPAQALSLTTAMTLSGSLSGHHSRFNQLECNPTFISAPAPGGCQ